MMNYLSSFQHKIKHRLRYVFASLLTGSTLVAGVSWLVPQRAIAQVNLEPSEADQEYVAQATVVPTSSIQQQTLYLNNDRSYSYNLEVEQPVTVNGLYLPAGAEIQGQYRPAEGGLQYVTNSVIIGDRAYTLNAVSNVIEDQKDPRDTSAGSIAEDAGIGAAGGAILGEILGDIDAPEVIGGAAAGAAIGNITADRVVVVEPDQPIYLYP